MFHIHWYRSEKGWQWHQQGGFVMMRRERTCRLCGHFNVQMEYYGE